jgi:predicted amidophosphoribosyltransferase
MATVDPTLPDEVECPACGASMKAELERCTHCGAALDAVIENDDLDYFPTGKVHDAH